MDNLGIGESAPARNMRPSSPLGSTEQLNLTFWGRGDTVGYYANRGLRRVESTVLERYKAAASGRVLELGCGAGRLTAHLCERAAVVHAMDISEAMVAHCRGVCPRAHVFEGDLRDLSGFEEASLDAVFATYNVLDVLADRERRRVLDEVHRILGPGGVLVFSSHNRAFTSRTAIVFRLLVGDPRRPLRSLARLPKRFANRRRMRRLERLEPGYAILNDAAHDFAVIHYNISRDAQERQLAEHGFRLVQCLDLDGVEVPRGSRAQHCAELCYVALRVGFGPVAGFAN